MKTSLLKKICVIPALCSWFGVLAGINNFPHTLYKTLNKQTTNKVESHEEGPEDSNGEKETQDIESGIEDVSEIACVSLSLSHGSTTICAGDTFDVCAIIDPPNSSIEWQINDVHVPAYDDMTCVAIEAVPGLNRITAIVTNSSCPGVRGTSRVPLNVILDTDTSSVSMSGDLSICSGDNANFMVTDIVNAGTNPSFQWFVNSTLVAGDQTAYNTTNLAEGDTVMVVMTSDAPCPAFLTDTALVIMDVDPTLVPNVSISGDTVICPGEVANFSISDSSNAGTNPDFQWYVNRTLVTGDQNTYSSTNLVDGDTVMVVMTSNAICPAFLTDTAFVIMNVNATGVPNVSMIGDTAVCAGTLANFTVSDSSNAGPDPSFQWFVNGVGVAGDQNTFSSNTLVDGDSIMVVIHSNDLCSFPNTDTALTIIMVRSVLMPTVALQADNDTACLGEPVILATFTSNAGNNPMYNWFLNGQLLSGPTSSDQLVIDSLDNNDVISVALISNLECITDTVVASQNISIRIENNQPSITLTADTSQSCLNDPLTFTATSVNGGTQPLITWLVNGDSIWSDFNATSVWVVDSLNPGDVVQARLLSNVRCLSGSPSILSNALFPTINVVQVSIIINPVSAQICLNDSLAFVASIVNGGSAPLVEWYLNDQLVESGINDTIYHSRNFMDGDRVHAVLTSNLPCAANNALDTSNLAEVNVSSTNPTLTLAGDTGFACLGDAVNFIASGINWGQNPTIRWELNGTVVHSESGVSSPVSYSFTNFVDTDVISASVISSLMCALDPVVSDTAVTPTIDTITTASVSIDIDGDPQCADETITVCATATNAGDSPIFTWFVNGDSLVQDSIPCFPFSPNLIDSGDVITVVLTSSAICVVHPAASEDTVTIDVDPVISPNFSLIGEDLYCSDDQATVMVDTSSIVDGNEGPRSWTVIYTSGSAIDTLYNDVSPDPPVFGPQLVQDGDQVTYVMESSYPCASPIIRSVTEFIAVEPNGLLNVDLFTTTNDTCFDVENTDFIFTAVGNDQLNTSLTTYYWYVNGELAALTDTNNYLLSNPVSGDSIGVFIETTQRCVDIVGDSDGVVLNFSYQPTAVVQGELSFDDLQAGETVILNGTGSTTQLTDPNNEVIRYTWFQNSTGEDGRVLTTGTDTGHLTYALNGEDLIYVDYDNIENNKYYLVIENEYCADTAVIFPTEDLFLVPNIFTPNGDGQHDDWIIVNAGKYPKMTVHIFSRWGREEIFRHDGSVPYKGNEWDGTIGSEPVPAGTYYYVIYKNSAVGSNRPLDGHVNVVR